MTLQKIIYACRKPFIVFYCAKKEIKAEIRSAWHKPGSKVPIPQRIAVELQVELSFSWGQVFEAETSKSAKAPQKHDSIEPFPNG